MTRTYENPYLTAYKNVRREKFGWFQSGIERDKLVRKFAWSIPDPTVVDMIRYMAGGRQVVDLMAGSGYWVWLLNQAGIPAIGYDIGDSDGQWEHVWCAPTKMCALETVELLYPEKHFPMIIWPPYNSDADTLLYEELHARGFKDMLYVGEGYGGCTGSDEGNSTRSRLFPHVARYYNPSYFGISDGCSFHATVGALCRTLADRYDDVRYVDNKNDF